MSTQPPIVALGELLWDLLPGGRRAGGAPFNFAFHCQQLGHPAIIVSRVGDDDLGRELREEVRRLGMSDEYIQTDHDHPTGTVEVTLDAAGQPTFRIIEDVAWDFIEWQPTLPDLARSARAVCFGTLGQREIVSQRTILAFLAQSRGPVVCDINLRPPFYSAATIRDSIRAAKWLKLNSSEVPTVVELLCDEGRDFTLRVPAGGLLCITRGADGCDVSTPDEQISLPGVSVKVADTVGAGDAFTAALLTQTLEGQSLREAARFANAYAAVVASKPGGTPPVSRAEVEALL